MKKSKWHHLKNKWLITAVILILAAAFIVQTRSGDNKPAFEVAIVSVANITEKVSVTGTISPTSKSNLSFKKGGVISSIYVKVGDAVERGQLIASLDTTGDRAALNAARATLADTARDLTPEELAVQKTALENAEKDAVDVIRDGFAKVQSALFS